MFIPTIGHYFSFNIKIAIFNGECSGEMGITRLQEESIQVNHPTSRSLKKLLEKE